ncbi:thioredoxin-like protein, partial [Rhodotorula diobovata]
IDFHAAWCGPCHAIAPVFEKLAAQYRGVTFAKVDVDKAQEIARAYKVTAMPTFAFVKGERKVHEVRGANAQA